MPRRAPSPSPADPPSLPIPECAAVLTALERLDKTQRVAVLSATIAFFDIGNQELAPVRV